MTTEQKAKAYDEALKQIKECTPDENGFITIYPQEIFPELKESEDERIRKSLIERTKSLNPSHYFFQDLPQDKIIAWLEKQCEQKSAWSEEDNTMLDKIISLFPNTPNIANFLKSLKDRVQPKVELSQLDKNILEAALAFVEQNNHFNYWKGVDKRTVLSALYSLRSQNWTKEDKERYISCLQKLGTGNPEQPETINSKWFKEHVYPQSTWKPSLEQMKALSIAMCGVDDPLFSLYQDLKKLSGE